MGTLQIHLIKKFGGAEFLHSEQDRSEAKSINIAAKGEVSEPLLESVHPCGAVVQRHSGFKMFRFMHCV